MSPEIEILFDKPAIVDRADSIFGGNIKKLLPPYSEIPEEFKSGYTKWNKVVSKWFFSGLPKETVFTPKSNIDKSAAIAHVRAVLVSFEPKHEHKEAGCAYLLSKWFDDITL